MFPSFDPNRANKDNRRGVRGLVRKSLNNVKRCGDHVCLWRTKALHLN